MTDPTSTEALIAEAERFVGTLARDGAHGASGCMAELLAALTTAQAERREFSSALEFGDGITEPAATLAEMLDPIKTAFAASHKHAECPVNCGNCGERLASTLCPKCNGAGGFYAGGVIECDVCGGERKVHEDCAGESYADLVIQRDEARAALTKAEEQKAHTDLETRAELFNEGWDEAHRQEAGGAELREWLVGKVEPILAEWVDTAYRTAVAGYHGEQGAARDMRHLHLAEPGTTAVWIADAVLSEADLSPIPDLAKARAVALEEAARLQDSEAESYRLLRVSSTLGSADWADNDRGMRDALDRARAIRALASTPPSAEAVPTCSHRTIIRLLGLDPTLWECEACLMRGGYTLFRPTASTPPETSKETG